LLVLAVMGPAEEKVLFTAPVIGDMTFSRCNGLFLAIWWGIGMGVLTFNGPFINTTNGYFAVWFGFICAVAGVGITVPTIKHVATSYSPYLLGFCVCALVVGLELAIGYLLSGANVRGIGYGMVVAVLGFFVGFTILLLEIFGAAIDPKLRRAVLTTMVVLWGLAALWLTFVGPFKQLGNGYFGLWVGLICVSKLMLDSPSMGAGADEEAMPITRARGQSLLDKVLADEKQAAMWGMFASSIVLIIAVASISTTTDLWGYALAVGIVACVFSFAGALLVENAIGNKPLMENAKTGPVTLNLLLALFLFLWWAIGVGFLTIRSPFRTTQNGYFAAWVGFASSFFGMGLTLASAKQATNSGLATQVLLAICSFLIIVETAQHISAGDTRAQNIYALVIACISITMVFVSIVLRQLNKPIPELVAKIQSVIRFIVWAILASWVTFVGPFETTSNGYFAAWGGVICCVILILAVWMPKALQSGGMTDTPTVAEYESSKDAEEGYATAQVTEATYGESTYGAPSGGYETKPAVSSYDAPPDSYPAPPAASDYQAAD